MTLLAVAVHGRGLVAADEPVFGADDEALLRGAAAFETLRVYDGRPFLLERHLERLGRLGRRARPAVRRRSGGARRARRGGRPARARPATLSLE